MKKASKPAPKKAPPSGKKKAGHKGPAARKMPKDAPYDMPDGAGPGWGVS